MREENNGSEKAYDPFESFRGMRDTYLDALSKTMIEAVNTESYAQATGAMLDSYLTASAPIREALEKAMVQTLQQLSLPSRQEVAGLAQRFTSLEMRLDDMDAKLDGMAKNLAEDRQARATANSQEILGEAISEATRKALRDASLATREDIADLAKSISQWESRLDILVKRGTAAPTHPEGTEIQQAATQPDMAQPAKSAIPAEVAKSTPGTNTAAAAVNTIPAAPSAKAGVAEGILRKANAGKNPR